MFKIITLCYELLDVLFDREKSSPSYLSPNSLGVGAACILSLYYIRQVKNIYKQFIAFILYKVNISTGNEKILLFNYHT
jgi:hypothetical protein